MTVPRVVVLRGTAANPWDLRPWQALHEDGAAQVSVVVPPDNDYDVAALPLPKVEVRTTGGGAKSPVWLQIMSDVITLPHLTLEIDEGPALGAALLAAVGTGTFASVPEACSATIRPVSETSWERRSSRAARSR